MRDVIIMWTATAVLALIGWALMRD